MFATNLAWMERGVW